MIRSFSKIILLISTAATLQSQTVSQLPSVLFFANPMQSDNDVVRRSQPVELSIAERHFAELSKGIFQTTITQDGTELTREKLTKYKAVVFFTAINPPGVDKEALIEFVRKGGGFVGIHSTANTFQNYPAFGEMLGANYDRRPWRTAQAPQTRVRIKVDDKTHPATKHLGDSFEITDDIYQYKNFDVSKVTLLLSLEPSSLDLSSAKVNKEDKHLPVAWCKSFGQGRVFYTMLGDWEPIWKNSAYRKHLIEAIHWSYGRDELPRVR